jgi:hypothetical protein
MVDAHQGAKYREELTAPPDGQLISTTFQNLFLETA